MAALGSMEKYVKVQLEPLDDIKLSKQSVTNILSDIGVQNYTELNNALINIFKECSREMDMLIKNINDLTLASLHVRNIFELYLILINVHSDRKELCKWYGQSYKDSTDIRNGFINLCNIRGLDTTELKNIQKFEDKNIKNSPYESHGGFPIKHLAEKHGYLDDYLFLYKLSSKLIHPSSMRVNSYDVLTEGDNYLSVIIKIGVYFCRKIEEFAPDVKYEKA